jgi:hypothetical protein
MTARGHVQGGVVVLDGQVPFPDGAAVEVRLIESPQQLPDGRHELLRYSGVFDDLPPDASSTVDQVLYGRPAE